MSVRPWLSALSTAVWLSAVALAQQSVIRVDVNLVRILATVKDPAGQLVGTLGKEDFTIADNGVMQQVSVFEHHTDQPAEQWR